MNTITLDEINAIYIKDQKGGKFMLFFEKTNKLSNLFICIFILFLVMTIIFFASSQFTEVLSYNFTNDLRGTVWMLVCFVISFSSLLAGVSLKYLIKEAHVEIHLIEERIKRDKSKN